MTGNGQSALVDTGAPGSHNSALPWGIAEGLHLLREAIAFANAAAAYSVQGTGLEVVCLLQGRWRAQAVTCKTEDSKQPYG